MTFENLKTQIQGKVHFIGVGGIGMSALAMILREVDIPVQGSDLSENYMTQKLKDKGVQYFVGHDAKNITDDICLIIETSIIKSDNPELIAARQKNIPVVTRADFLARVMKEKKGITIAGTHGKTSTTAITSLMLEFANLDPTVINGGLINHYNSNYKIGNGEYLVAESDESDASFVKLPSFIGAVTNIEPEHLEFVGYGGDFEKQKAYFERYINQIPQDGLCVLCIDDLEIGKIYDRLKLQKSNLVTYSIKDHPQADILAKNITMNASGLNFDVVFTKKNRVIKNVKMPIYGVHNASNSLVAIAIADFLNISDDMIIKALANFTGVKRRFTKVGELNGVTVIDDYAHHPTEVKAVLKAARALVTQNKVIALFQPYKYTRIRDLYSEFCHAFDDADVVLVMDIYSAGQASIEGITKEKLAQDIKAASNKEVIILNKEEEAATLIKANSKAGDMLICLGAGTITNLAQKLGSNK